MSRLDELDRLRRMSQGVDRVVLSDVAVRGKRRTVALACGIGLILVGIVLLVAGYVSGFKTLDPIDSAIVPQTTATNLRLDVMTWVTILGMASSVVGCALAIFGLRRRTA
jgi:uncharacterized membrane protein YphA (DoxX/SURF4 family)